MEMRFSSLTIIRALRLLFIGATIAAVLTATTSCDKKPKSNQTDPYAERDEIVRIDARRQVKFPNAIQEGDEAFYLVTRANPSGTPLSNAQWVYIDYTTISFDNRFIGSNVVDSAKLYRKWDASTRYVSALKQNNAEALGKELYNILQRCREGEVITVGMSAKAGNANGMWQSRPNESVISTLTLARAINDPEAEEKKLINDFLGAHAGFVKQDSVYKKVDEVGQGKVVPDNGQVHCKYGAYFLDGTLLETNDEIIAARYGKTLNRNQSQLLAFSVKGDPSVVSGFSGICVGEHIGTKFEIIVPSASAYKDKGKGNVRPYEPLRFEITIVNHTTL